MKKLNAAIFGMLTLVASTVVLNAQNQSITAAAGDKYVISARAGGVNFVEGTVAIVRKNGPNGRLLKGDTVEIGDRVSTATDGRVEILLNPGSYARLGGNSAFEFKTTSLEDLQLKLDRGSATFEVYAGDDFLVTVGSPRAKFKLINSGIFRLDVAEDGAGTLSVWKGRALVGATDAGIIKAGRSMTVSGSKVSTAKFERDKGDALDQWSKDRGKQLAKLTNSLQRRDLRNVLLNSFSGRQWNMYDSFGLWVYDRFTGTHCFLPFGGGWYSPYGFGFDRYMGWYDLPTTVYYPRHTNPSTGTPTSGPVYPPTGPSEDRRVLPPFVKMQGGMGRGRGDGDTRESGGEVNSPPVYTPPIFSPPSPPSPPKSETPPPSPVTTKDGQ